MYRLNFKKIIKKFRSGQLLAMFVCLLSLSFSSSSFSQEIQAAPSLTISNQLIGSKIVERQQCPDSKVQAKGENGVLLAYGCCRVCRVGKACGNSCINRDLNCHQPAGCACDG